MSTCLECGKEFYSRDAKRGGGKFCSVKHRRKYKARHSKNYLKKGKKAIHRIVMEKKLGRKLRRGETVHHIDGNKLNNRPRNLMLFPSQSAHIKHEFATGAIKRARKAKAV